MRIRPLQSGEAGLLRQTRLRAVDDAPHAFGQSRFEAATLSPAFWERQVKTHTESGGGVLFFADSEDEPPVGLVAVRRDLFAPECAHVTHLWVAPEWRRSGWGGALVAAALYWARRQQLTRILTWTPERTNAARIFARHGFVPTGRSFPQPGNPGVTLCEWTCALFVPDAAPSPQTIAPIVLEPVEDTLESPEAIPIGAV